MRRNLLRPGRSSTWLLFILAFVAVAGIVAWQVFRKPVAKRPDGGGEAADLAAAIRANNRGIGQLEQFEYAQAAESFQEAVRQAPDWLSARINLGIAYLNSVDKDKPETVERCQECLQQVLSKEPANPYGSFCRGLLAYYLGNLEDAASAFEAVLKVDPADPYTWYWLGQALPYEPERAVQCYQRAVDADPYLNAAVYGLAMAMRTRDLQKTKELLAQHQALDKWSNPIRIRYSEMGRYATAVDRPPDANASRRSGPIPLFVPDSALKIQLAPGARWATNEDFGHDKLAQLQRAIRKRFGATIVTLDYNQDGKQDLFLLQAVVEGGKIRDLLLRNDGNGSFSDVTVEAGLAEAHGSLGCSVADFDNDGRPDLFITGAGAQRLYRNTAKGRFEDVTKVAGLDKLTTVCLGSAFLDIDQDGDLDLVVCQYAATVEQALEALRSDTPGVGGKALLFLNVGEAKPASVSDDPSPLSTKFRSLPDAASVFASGPTVSVAIADLDRDLDLDLLVLADQRQPKMILNDRLLRFHAVDVPPSLAPAAKFNGALSFDLDQDERPDLLLLSPFAKPRLLMNQCNLSEKVPQRQYAAGVIDSPSLLQAQVVDIDADGWPDIVGLSSQGLPVLLHSDGRRLVHALDGLGRDADWPRDILAVLAVDCNGDARPDVVTWSESAGIQVRLNQKNDNHALALRLTRHRRTEANREPTRTNADALGAVVKALAGDHRVIAENTTRAAGLGQSAQPLYLGLGNQAEADVVRVVWPDNVPQAEFNVPSNQLFTYEETNRKGTSCPILFAWNGERFSFVTDFLGAGSMGEMLAGGGHRPPRPEESVKIEPEQLVPLNGHYLLKICQPMNEVVYLDRLQLIAVDHPGDLRVYPDERFVSSSPPVTQDLLALGQPILPRAARDHRNRDVTDILKKCDRRTASGFAKRSWLGFAEEHWVELDFGDRLAGFTARDPLFLCLAGWTDYAYPESIAAASQAGVSLLPPVLERLDADGKWQTVVSDAGFPAGLPRMIVVDVTGKLTGPVCKLRLRTNMHVYWDQIFAAPLLERVSASSLARQRSMSSAHMRVVCLDPLNTVLEARGSPKEYSPDGRLPTLYDYDRREAVPASRLRGKVTRLGAVTELLTAADDRFVIFAPGEEIAVTFLAQPLAELPAGWRRSFVLRTWGYCKDASPFTESGDRVEPLPFRGMKDYPYAAGEHYPGDAVHETYQRLFNSRQIGTK